MAGRRNDFDLEPAERKHVAVLQEAVEVAAFRLPFAAELRRECFLHVPNPRADGGLRANAPFQMVGCRQMVGMRMRFQDPFDRQARVASGSEHPFGAFDVDPPAGRIITEHGIDDRRRPRDRIADEIANAVRGLVEEGLHARYCPKVPIRVFHRIRHALVRAECAFVGREAVEPGTPRMERCELFVPASDIRIIG